MLREVDDEPAVADAVAGRVVPPSANRHLQLVGAREVERDRDVGRAAAARDHRRPSVDERVEAEARSVVLDLAGYDHVTLERVA